MMKRLSLIFIILLTPIICDADVINVTIKGVDDGVKTNKQQDHKEALMNAKLQAIERAGVEIESVTRVVNFQMRYKAVESKAKAVLLPGFQVMDIGYQTDGTYQVVLVGKVKTISEGIDSKELRYAKSLMERGEKSKAKKIVDDIIHNSKDDNAVAEAMYSQVLWKFKLGVDTLDKLNAYYPSSKYVNMLEDLLVKRIGIVTDQDDHFIAYDKGIVLDTKTNLMWADRDNEEKVTLHEAKMYCEKYKGGGYTDWRMPSGAELQKIYDRNKNNRYGNHVTKLINITNDSLWATGDLGVVICRGVLFVDFDYDKFQYHCMKDHLASSEMGGALPVRYAK